jgi:hypothetical protein
MAVLHSVGGLLISEMTGRQIFEEDKTLQV